MGENCYKTSQILPMITGEVSTFCIISYVLKFIISSENTCMSWKKLIINMIKGPI